MPARVRPRDLVNVRGEWQQVRAVRPAREGRGGPVTAVVLVFTNGSALWMPSPIPVRAIVH